MGSKQRFSNPQSLGNFYHRRASVAVPPQWAQIGWAMDLAAGIPEQITAAVVPIYCYQWRRAASGGEALCLRPCGMQCGYGVCKARCPPCSFLPTRN